MRTPWTDSARRELDRRVTSPITRTQLVHLVNQFRLTSGRALVVPLLKPRAWQRAAYIARQNGLLPADVLSDITKHGSWTPQSEQAAA